MPASKPDHRHQPHRASARQPAPPLRALSLSVALAFSAGAGMVALGALGTLPGNALAQALPTGGQIAAGAATISNPTANSMVVKQTTDRVAINWQSFNIGAGNSVRFDQPATTSIALNRVLGNSRSEIFGNLSSNGQVFLINPNGVLFGASAQVDVGGLVASTLNLTDRNFLDGKFVFSDPTNTGSVINQGRLTAKGNGAGAGGYLALLGHQAINQGTMQAHLGSVVLGAGGTAQLTLNDSKLVKFEVTQNALNALAENGGLIRANGGQVILSAGAKESLLASTVNNTGIIEAQTVDRVAGNILLLAGMTAGTTNVGGTLDASAPAALNPNSGPEGNSGGFIETSAAKVKIADNARATTAGRADANGKPGKTGTWLIDPTDFTIAASGGDITGATLGTQLASNNITLATSAAGAGNGDMLVNDNVTWATSNTLTLNAHRNVDFSGGGTLNGGSTGNVTLNAGLNGTSGAIIHHATNTVVTGDTLIANARTGIGNQFTGALRTNVNQAALTNTQSGDIYLLNGRDASGNGRNLTVAAAATNGHIFVQTAAGANDVNASRAGGNITVGTVNGLAGVVTTDPGNAGLGLIVLAAGQGGISSFSDGGGGGSINVNAALNAAQHVTLDAGSGGSGLVFGSGGSGGSINVNAALNAGQRAELRSGSGGIIGSNSSLFEGGNGGSINVNAAVNAGQRAELTSGSGGSSNGSNGRGGSGGSITLNASLTSAQASLTAGDGGRSNVRPGGGGSITLNAALTSAQAASLTAGGGGNSNSGSDSGGNGGSITLNAALTSAQTANLTAGYGGYGGYTGGGDYLGSGSGGHGGSITLNAALTSTEAASLTVGDGGRGGNNGGSNGSAGQIKGTAIEVSAGGNLTVSGAINATSGDVSLKSGMNAGNALTLSHAAINAGANNLTLHGDTLSAPGALSLSGNTVSLKTGAGLGSAGSAVAVNATQLNLENTTSGNVNVTNTGAINLTGALNANNATLQTTNAGAAITQSAGGNLTVNTLNLAANGGNATFTNVGNNIGALGSVNLGAGALTLSNARAAGFGLGAISANGGIDITNTAGDLSTTAALTSDGSIALRSTTGALALGGTVTSNNSGVSLRSSGALNTGAFLVAAPTAVTGNVSLTSDTSTVTIGAGGTTAGGTLGMQIGPGLSLNVAGVITAPSVALTADSIDISAAINATNTISLAPVTAGTAARIGGAAGPGFVIDSTELGFLSSAATLSIGKTLLGTTTAGAMQLGALNVAGGTLNLFSSGAVTSTGALSVGGGTGKLNISAVNGIGSAGAPLLTQLGSASLANTQSGGIFLTNTGNLNVAASSVNGDIAIRTANGADALGTFGAAILNAGAGGTAGSGGNINVTTVGGLSGVNTTGSGSLSLVTGNGGSADGGSVLANSTPPGTVLAAWGGNGGTGGAGGSIALNAPVSVAANGDLTLATGTGGSANGGRGGDGAMQPAPGLAGGFGGRGGQGGSAGAGGSITVNTGALAARAITLGAGAGGSATGGAGGAAGAGGPANDPVPAGPPGGAGPNGAAGTAGAAGSVGGASLDVTAATNLSVSGQVSASGSISLKAGMNAGNTLALAQATLNAGANNLTLQGYNLNVSATLNLTGNTISIKTATGIGTSVAPILTTASNLALENTVSGGIYATNTGNVTAAAASTNGDVVLRTASGANGTALSPARAGGSLTVGTVGTLAGLTATGSGNVTLATGGGGNAFDDSGNFGNAGGAGGSIVLNGSINAVQAASLSTGAGGKGGAATGTGGGALGGRGGTGGDGGSVTFNTLSAVSGQSTSLILGAGGVGGDTYVATGGFGGMGGSIVFNAQQNVTQSTTYTSGTGGAGGNNLQFSGGAGGKGGAITFNAAYSAAQDASFATGSGGAGGTSLNPAGSAGAAGAAGVINGSSVDITAAQNLSINGGVAATSGNVSLKASMNAGNTLTLSQAGVNAGTNNLTVQGYGISAPSALSLTGNTVALKTGSGLGSAGSAVAVNATQLNLENTTSGDVYVTNTGHINVTGAASNVNTAHLVSTGGDVTLGTVINAGGSGDAIRLAGTRFINNAGATALATPNGRWVVWSATPVNNSFGGLQSGNAAAWSSAYPGGAGATLAQNGNRFAFSVAPLTGVAVVTADNQSKVYGDTFSGFTFTAADGGGGAAYANAFTDTGGGVVNLTGAGAGGAGLPGFASTGALATATRVGGNGGGAVYDITVNVAGLSAAGYSSVVGAGGFLTITPRALTVAASGVNKTYDGNANGTVTLIDNRVNSDVLTTAYTGAAFLNKNSGVGKALNVSGISLTGAAAVNYTLANTTAATTANIDQRGLTVSGITAANKTYDGLLTASVNTGAAAFAGLVSGDVVNVTATGAFVDKNVNVGPAKTVNLTSSYGGADWLNYNITGQSTATANITARGLTIGATGVHRTYDGTATGTVTLIDNRVTGDVLTTSYGGAAFLDKHAGTGKTLNVSGITLAGTDAGNYSINTTAATTANIAQAALTLTASTQTRTYDGSTNSNGVVGVAGLVGGDTLTGATQSFDGRNASALNGRTLLVNGGYTVNDGNNGGNYLVSAVNATGTINQAALTLTAATQTRTYNGTDASSGTVGVAGLLGGDTLTGASQRFDSANASAANGRTLLVNGGYTLNDGNSGGNYLVNTVNATGTINQAALTLTASTQTRTYDGSTNSSGAVGVTGLFGTDTVTGTSQRFDSRNASAANGRALLVNGGYTVNDGNSGGNYLVSTVNAAGTINQAALTLTAAAQTRTYNGTDASSATVGVAGLVGGDTVTGTSQRFDSANASAANGRTLLVNGGYTLNDGNSGGNYLVNTVNATGTINQAALTLTASTQTRTYDGSTNSSGAVGVTGLFGTDTVTGTSQRFDSRNASAANGRSLLVNGGYTVNDGNSGGNYLVSTVNAAGTINQAALTLTAATQTRTYNGTDASSGTVGVAGLIGPDTVTGTSQRFDSANASAANGRTLLVNGGYSINDGNSGGNYLVNTVGTPGTINQAPLTITANNATKTYGSTINFAGTAFTSTGLVNGETIGSVSLASTGAASGAIVANSPYAITPSGGVAALGSNFALTNYLVSYLNGNLAVNRAPLTVAANPLTKVGDNVPFAGGNGVSFIGLVNGETSASVVGGTPAYGGTSQGAVNPGTYVMTPGGLSLLSNNYTMTYADGGLTITASTSQLPGAQGAINSAQQGGSGGAGTGGTGGGTGGTGGGAGGSGTAGGADGGGGGSGRGLFSGGGGGEPEMGLPDGVE